jgi:hypothetical protein
MRPTIFVTSASTSIAASVMKGGCGGQAG